ncbi:unnamed protein product, partial [Brassica rapa subsp. narinosa]
MIMESTKDWKHEPEPEELVAEDATLKNIWKQEEYIRSLTCYCCVLFSVSGTMAGDQKGKLTKEERLLLKSMNAQMQQMLDTNMGEFRKELRQNKHKWYKEEEAGRGQQSYKQKAHTSSRPHQASRTPKSNIHSSYNQIVTKPQLYVFTGEGDYLKWERTMEKWLCYNKILKREALAYVMSQLKGNVFKWLLQEEDDRRYYKEPAITTWEDLKFLLRKKYASKGHTSLKSPKKKVISATDFKSEKSETKMADYEKEISSLVKEILKTSKHLDKQKKLPKNQEPVATVSELNDAEPDSAAPIQEAQTKTSMGKGKFEKEQEFSLFLPHSESNFDNSFDELTCLEPVQPSRIVSLSRHDLGLKHVVFEPGGYLWDHRDNGILMKMKSAAPTSDFGDLLSSEVKGMHVSAQREFHYETNWRMLPTLSWIQQTRQRSKWPLDHQDIVNFAKHIGLAKFCELLISDWAERLQIYLWKPGAYDSTLIILGQCSARARTRLGNKELETDQNALLLDHVKVRKPPDLQKLQDHFRDCQTKSGNEDFTKGKGEVITGAGRELMFSSQIKEKPPDGLSLHQTPNKQTRGQTVLSARIFEKRGYSNDQSIKNGSLAKLEMQQSNLGSCLAASIDIGAVRGSYLSNQKELSNKLNCNGNYTHQGLTSNWNHVQSFSNERVMGSTSRVILCLLCLNFSEFRTSQSYLWRPGEHAKHAKTKNKREEDKRFKPPDLSQEKHQDVTCFILIKEAPP